MTWYQTISDVFSEITNTSFDFEFVFEDEVQKNVSIPVENIGVPLIFSRKLSHRLSMFIITSFPPIKPRLFTPILPKKLWKNNVY